MSEKWPSALTLSGHHTRRPEPAFEGKADIKI
jgi:hypothetical protein